MLFYENAKIFSLFLEEYFFILKKILGIDLVSGMSARTSA